MDLSGAEWRKSSRSGSNGGACVEVAVVTATGDGADRAVAVRDSKDPNGPSLAISPATWEAFISRIRAGHFDLA